MNDRAVVRLSGVSLCYRLAKQRIPSLKEYAIHFVKGALSYEKLWALSDVDLEITRGETVGIVGRNGAGKSTLLKVISRVLMPTRGRAEVSGRVAPILELGAGFDH
jgi:ABC-type polysaccharide/polyol phosphate transport system ATPase subunit